MVLHEHLGQDGMVDEWVYGRCWRSDGRCGMGGCDAYAGTQDAGTHALRKVEVLRCESNKMMKQGIVLVLLYIFATLVNARYAKHISALSLMFSPHNPTP